MKLGTIVCVTATFFLAGLPQPGRAAIVDAYSGVNLNIRTGPSVRFPTVGVLGAGTALAVHSCLRGYSWCDVSASGLRGWVSGAYIQIARNKQRFSMLADETEVELPVVTFEIDSYWAAHYRDYDFYGELDYWEDYRWEEDAFPPHDPDDWAAPPGGVPY